MPVYNTPGVYVEEISTLPPSVAEVSTAVPAFLGYTAQIPSSATAPYIARVTTLLEYEQLFGGPARETFTVTMDASGNVSGGTRTTTGPSPGFQLYYAMQHYFLNGGGACYVVSLGTYSATPAKKDFEAGLALVEREDEPTLIVLTDAVNLKTAASSSSSSSSGSGGTGGSTGSSSSSSSSTPVYIDYYTLAQEALTQAHKLGDRFAILDVPGGDVDSFRNGIGTNYLAYGAAYHPCLQSALSYQYQDADVKVSLDPASPTTTVTLDTLKAKPAYQRVSAYLAAQYVSLHPSAAMAGIYASVDRDRGVWKAPANVSVASVIGPLKKITNDEQDGLNVDPTAGKSINAIRAFTGKGTLVWGARTLAGNDNEWRYVPVRRLFIMIEESARKATSFAVFEPNDATTWLKVKGMIESFLYGLWERGALAGPSPAAAYFVHVGLGKTMTAQDILEGRMIVEIGIAAVRPAEFIILRFSHKLQEA